MKKSTLGFVLGFFFSLLGLLGLLACSCQEDKDEFMSGWVKGLIVSIVIGVVAGMFISCLSVSMLGYYY